MIKNYSSIFICSFFLCSIIGFMIRLPKIFHHIDKELHGIFYFITVIIFSVIYPKKWGIVSAILTVFGIMIELAQHFSNKITICFFGKAIHGRFDLEDIKYNIFGLILGLLFYHLFRISSSSLKST
jgi:hypothetical protein